MHATGQKVRKRGYSGARLELIKKAASLSLEEYTIPEIARELRISDSKVRRLLSACEGLPTSCLSETAQVARLLDLERLDGVLSVAFPVALGTESATDERSGSRDKTSLRERWEAFRIVLDVLKQRAKLLRYEDVQAENHRKLQVEFQRLLITTDW
jgi:hypothetical protein